MPQTFGDFSKLSWLMSILLNNKDHEPWGISLNDLGLFIFFQDWVLLWGWDTEISPVAGALRLESVGYLASESFCVYGGGVNIHVYLL